MASLRWIAVTFATDIQGPLRINYEVNDPLTWPGLAKKKKTIVPKANMKNELACFMLYITGSIHTLYYIYNVLSIPITWQVIKNLKNKQKHSQFGANLSS